LIHCPKCRCKHEMDAEKVEWERPRRTIYGFRGTCGECGRDCYHLKGSGKWEGGETPHKIRDQRYRDRKKQRELYDPIENLPKLKAYYIPDSP